VSCKGLIGNNVHVIGYKVKRRGLLFRVLINFLRLPVLTLGLATREFADPGLLLCYQFGEGNGYVIIDEEWLSSTLNVRRHASVSIRLYSPKCREAFLKLGAEEFWQSKVKFAEV